MAAAMTIKHFFARQTDLDGPIKHKSGLGHDDLMIERVALSSEAATIGRGDHPNVCGGHFQNLSERTMEIMRCLGAGPDCQFSIWIFDGHGSVLLNGEMSVSLKEESVFENLVCFRESGFHVAKLQGHVLMNVSFFTVFVNTRLGSCKRLLGIGDGR